MPGAFTESFAARLDARSLITVREAKGGERLTPGLALVAPGGKHLLLQRNSLGLSVQVKEGPLVNGHRPSVDVLFRSVAKVAGANSVGALMTGMGSDGAAGLLEMRRAGARTFAQDEQSSVVFGMPKAAIDLGAASRVVSLEHLSGAILGALDGD
jgi:two-component system chemotaxis response regulator CheB